MPETRYVCPMHPTIVRNTPGVCPECGMTLVLMRDTQTYPIKGMNCAGCAVTIEKALKSVPGVHSAEANYGNESVQVSFDSSETNPEELSHHLKTLGYSLMLPQGEDHSLHTGVNQSKQEKIAEIAKMRHSLIIAIPLTLVSVVVMIAEMFAGSDGLPQALQNIFVVLRNVLPLIATYILFVTGRLYLVGLYRFVRHGHATMDTLVGMGTLVAYLYSIVVTFAGESLQSYVGTGHTYYDVTIIVITFVTLGKYLEARSKLHMGDAIEKLLNLQEKTAWVVREAKEIEIPVSQVYHGDLVIIKPGARIPVDGVVTNGSSFVDEAVITGESVPVEKKIGDRVVAGTINTRGAFVFRATSIGSETVLAHIIKMVARAQGSRAPIQSLADKISSVFVPAVLVIAILSLVGWVLFSSETLGLSQSFSYGLTAFVGVLVISCPCALGLATPTAIIVGVGKGAREGILIKDAATLQKLCDVDIVVLDKTGTITNGKSEFLTIKNYSDKDDDSVLAILAALESGSEHPIAHAVNQYVTLKNLSVPSVQDFESVGGRGVKGVVDGEEYYAGNVAFAATVKISFDTSFVEEETQKGHTPVLLFTKKEIIAVAFVADTLRTGVAAVVRELNEMGVSVAMLTGDHTETARAIASEVNIKQVFADVSPEEKLLKIKEFQNNGLVVAMVGDGVNDAPALAQADIGIALGVGTDVAIEAAGVTLLGGDLSKLVNAIHLSKITMRIIKQNLFWAFIFNLVGIPLAAGLFYPFFGWLLSPVFAGSAMAFSSVLVVTNSLRLNTKIL